MSDSIVGLNVGGTRFCTSHTTLTWPGPDSFFGALLSDRMPSARGELAATVATRFRTLKD